MVKKAIIKKQESLIIEALAFIMWKKIVYDSVEIISSKK